MTTKEIHEMYQQKAAFTQELGNLLEKYHVSQIHDMKYENKVRNEIVSFYDGDRKQEIDVSGNSELAIMHDVIMKIW